MNNLGTFAAPLMQLERCWSGTNINHVYDPLQRLTDAQYDDGAAFHYTYDATGNRLSLTTPAGEVGYSYDAANRLTQAGGLSYTWDDNGNLLSDGTNTYTYDHANRLTGVSGQVSYAYNGLGDRLQETANGATTNFTMDLANGLTQVLADGTNTYLYGAGRIAQGGGEGMQYFIGDALGSVRQLVDSNADIVLAQAYEPYGQKLKTAGAASSAYGFTGEMQDASRVYLRARFYEPGTGRFMSRDTWDGNDNQPASYNKWLYALANPTRWTDRSGKCYDDGEDTDGTCDYIDPSVLLTFNERYNITFENSGKQWVSYPREYRAVIRAVTKVANRLAPYAHTSPSYAFREIFGGIKFRLQGLNGLFGEVSGVHLVKVDPGKLPNHNPQNGIVHEDSDPLARLIVHELGHTFSNRLDDQYVLFRKTYPDLPNTQWAQHPEQLLLNKGIYDINNVFITGGQNGIYNRNGGDGRAREVGYLGDNYAWWEIKAGCPSIRHYTGYLWHRREMDDNGNSSGEDWADIFQNWVYDNSFVPNNKGGIAISNWVDIHMYDWVRMAMYK